MSPNSPNQPFDVFLSHNSKDKPAVEALAIRLTDEAKLQVWLDKWNLIPGEPWQDEIERALDQAHTCAVFLGPHEFGGWHHEEMRAALDQRIADRTRKFRVIPVLLPGAVMPDRSKLPAFLSRLTWVDFRQGLDNAEAFRRLVAGIRGIAPGRAEGGSTPANVECPYRGLEVFDEEHARFFFGREAMTQHLVEALRPTRFLCVLGPSGSGKSSLVRAGLLPQLRAGKLPGSQSWQYVVFKPGAHPIEELALNLAALQGAQAQVSTATQLIHDFKTTETALHLFARLLLRTQAPDTQLFILVDQFEEVFTLCQDAAERAQFIKNLRYAGTIEGGRTVIVPTMRADFLARAAESPDLAELLSTHQFIVNPMEPDELRRAIEEPARLAGLRFELSLVERILNDVGREPGALPLLEHALRELFEKRSRENMLTMQSYERSGGVQGALAQKAEAIFARFTPEQQTILRRVMLRLTQPGEGTADTRRRAAKNELWAKPEEQDAVEKVIAALASKEARLITTSRDAGGEVQLDVAHETLIRGWPRLNQWITGDREGLRLHHRLAEDAKEWDKHNKDKSYLYQGARLIQVDEWRQTNKGEMNKLELAFLNASFTAAETQKNARRRQRYLLTSIPILILILCLVLVFGKRQQADYHSRELAAMAKSQLPVDPELGLLLAMEAVDTHNTDIAEEALRSSLLESHLRVTLRGHSGTIIRAVFSPDNKLILTASEDGTARVWDARSGRSQVELRGHIGKVQNAAFSLDGTMIITAGEDKTAQVWETSSGKNLAVLRGHNKALTGASFSPNGRLVVTASQDGTAQVWDVSASTSKVVLRGHGDTINSQSSTAVRTPTFSADGSKIITAGQDGTARIWDAQSGRALAILKHQNYVNTAVFSSNGAFAVTASNDKTACIWETSTGHQLVQLKGHKDEVRGAIFSNDDKAVVTISEDGTARVWDASTGETLHILQGHSEPINKVAISYDNKLIATASLDGSARVWDASTGRTLLVLRGHTKGILSVAFSTDGKRLVTSSEDETARIWEVATWQQQFALSGSSGAFSADGSLVVTATQDNSAEIWDAKTGKRLAILRGHTGKVQSVAFSLDGKKIVTASEDKTTQIWDANTGRSIRMLPVHESLILKATFNPTGEKIITASDDGTVCMWDVSTGHTIGSPMEGHIGQVYDAAFSPDGKKIVTASEDATARIWDAGNGRLQAELRGHTGPVFKASFSPNGRWVVTASQDNTARVWDANAGHPLGVLQGHAGRVRSAAFSPDGAWVITASDDKMVRLWATPLQYGTAGDWNLNSVGGLLEQLAPVVNAEFSPDGKSFLTVSSEVNIGIYACTVCGSIKDIRALADTRVTRPLAADERRQFLRK